MGNGTATTFALLVAVSLKFKGDTLLCEIECVAQGSDCLSAMVWNNIRANILFPLLDDGLVYLVHMCTSSPNATTTSTMTAGDREQLISSVRRNRGSIVDLDRLNPHFLS